MTDWEVYKFYTGLYSNLWQGFAKGFYHKRTGQNKFTPDSQCLGEWMDQDLLAVDDFVFKALSAESIMDLTLTEAKTAADDFMDLIFLND